VAVLILDLCDGVLKDWGKLSDPERSQVYKLVRDLHRIGISHEDLEPRNIARVREGGFRLIDFSESRWDRCKGSKVQGQFTLLIAHLSSCLIQKTDVFRTASIAKTFVETVAPSRCQFGVKVLMASGVFWELRVQV